MERNRRRRRMRVKFMPHTRTHTAQSTYFAFAIFAGDFSCCAVRTPVMKRQSNNTVITATIYTVNMIAVRWKRTKAIGMHAGK